MKNKILFLFLATALSAAAVQAAPVITFDATEIVVNADGHPVVLLLEGTRGYMAGGFPGADGMVRFPVAKGAVMNAVAVDMASGVIGFNAIGVTPQTTPMPPGLIMRGEDGTWTRFVTPDSVSRFLWIRPGIGAWGGQWSNPATFTDQDGTAGNGVRFTQISAMQQFIMINSSVPNGVQNGDIFVALAGSSTRMTGTVDNQLASTSPGVISFASPSAFSVNEGDSREIVLTRTIGTTGTVSARLRTVPGTATPGVDYNALNQIITFAPGEAIKKATFNTIDDDAFNTTVSLTLELLDATGATIGGSATRGVDIFTNDPLPAIAFVNESSSVPEQNAPWTLNVPVVLQGKSRAVATANYAIVRDGLAGATGQVTIAAGQTTASIPLNIAGNTTPEANYELTLFLNAGPNATAGTPNITHITVTNDDVSGSLSVADVSVPETNAAGSFATFHIALAQAMPQEVRVSYATANDSATAGSDFIAKSDVAVFPPGQTSVLVNVEIVGDTVPESDERFLFTLTDPVGATITRAVATGTIRDDDTSGVPPTLSISATTVIEKTGANSDGAFRVTLSPAQAQEVRVSYATVDGVGATAGADYLATSGVLAFAPGETSKVVTVTVLGDSVIEPNETFGMLLSAPVGASISGTGRAEITIVDDDLPQINSNDVTVQESVPNAVVQLRITPQVSRAASVTWATANGTATAGQDYIANAGSATFAETQSIVIEILQDSLQESNETFYVDFTSVANATLERQRVAITITDDDRVVPARISVADTSVIETTGSDAAATFTVTLMAPVSSEVRVSYATSDLTAMSGADYGARSGTLVFAPGQVNATVTVPIFGDALAEGDEKFRLTLFDPVNATLGRSIAEATIQDDDSGPRPSMSISAARVIEGTGPNTDAVFVVTLSAASTTNVRVDYATANGSAIEGVDYLATLGTILFGPGEVSKMVVVPVVGDSIAEPEERFTVSLTNATGALLATPSAEGTIVDDDVSRRRAARH